VNRVRLLILGTGAMANTHAAAFASIPGVELAAAVDPRAEVLAAFRARHGIAQGFASLDEALAWGGFDAAANVTPDAAHHLTTMALLKAGKHVLCEKPLATSEADAAQMARAAEASGRVAMVNLTYRNVAALPRAARMVADGAIGTVRHFEASYFQSWLTQAAWGDWRTEPQWLWRLSTRHGSKGVLGDVGIHILDFALFAAGLGAKEISCRLAVFDKAPGGRIGDYTLDANDSAAMQVVLENGALGTVAATRYASGHLNDLRLRLYGEKGGLEMSYESNISRLRACLGANLPAARWEEVECEPAPTVFQCFVSAIRGEGPPEPNFARGAMLQRLLDLAGRSAAEGGRALAV
jgi:predicted dehydrogenase